MHSEFRKTRSPYGFPFLDPNIAENLFKKTDQIKSLLIAEGYRGVVPATLDFPETFQEYETFNAFTSRDSLGEDLYLRSDATAQVIKGFSNFLEHSHNEDESYRFFYALPVFRDARKSYPKLREVYQIGAEHIGSDSLKTIPGLIRLAWKIMKEILAIDVQMIIGDIRVYQYISRMLQTNQLKEMVQNRDVTALELLFTADGWAPDIARKLWTLLLYAPEFNEWQNQWKELKSSLTEPKQIEMINDMEELVEPSRKMNEDLQKKNIPICWEPLLVRNVDYYTSIIFEGYVNGLSYSPLRGGAYDHLVAKYSNRQMNACGFALDMSSLIL